MKDMWIFKRLEVKCNRKGPIGQLCGNGEDNNYCCWICFRLDECAKSWEHHVDGSRYVCPRGVSHWCSSALTHWKRMQVEEHG